MTILGISGDHFRVFKRLMDKVTSPRVEIIENVLLLTVFIIQSTTKPEETSMGAVESNGIPSWA